MKFTEETLEQAVIELFGEVDIPHHHGETIHKEMSDVLLRDDLRAFLQNRYAGVGITQNEIDSILRKLDLYPSSALYESNRDIIRLIADGFTLKREDRSQKDIYIELLDFETASNNIFKIVNQLEIQGTEKRIGVVNTKYARKQVQDFLKRMNIYGSTVWYEETKDDVMHFKITNPFLEIDKWLNNSQ